MDGAVDLGLLCPLRLPGYERDGRCQRSRGCRRQMEARRLRRARLLRGGSDVDKGASGKSFETIRFNSLAGSADMLNALIFRNPCPPDIPSAPGGLRFRGSRLIVCQGPSLVNQQSILKRQKVLLATPLISYPRSDPKTTSICMPMKHG